MYLYFLNVQQWIDKYYKVYNSLQDQCRIRCITMHDYYIKTTFILNYK